MLLSLQLRSAYQVSKDQPSPVETHYANGFSNYMRAIQQAPSCSSNKGGDSESHLKQQEQALENTLPTEVKTESAETVCNHHQVYQSDWLIVTTHLLDERQVYQQYKSISSIRSIQRV
jgi:hypothetical protein